ncbi:hypothetical protein [Archangium violaceum]|uniref:Lipoprotein n=1 Tax=Archangium violaceum Cb vi76 TaxID=1406225 RepID=A0A084SYZ3_9BACT|nr:hypothetical protein [Archangium violaceum]KFA93678.1 hypothetical protein Q664_07915 [Archangium violaceum Cb vi76]
MKRMLRSLFVTGLAGLVLSACGTPLATPEYPGEPLLTLSGTVTSERTEPLPSPTVELVWLVPRVGEDLIVTDSVPVQGQFPSHFTLSLHRPPDDSAIVQTAYGRMAIAYIGVFDEDARRFLGAAENYVLSYLPEPVEAGSEISKWLDKGGGARALSAGYHLIHAEPPSEAKYRAYQECLANAPTPADRMACWDQHDMFDTLTVAGDDLNTSIKVRIPNDPSKLRLPQFT